jgi:hypothetical protein
MENKKINCSEISPQQPEYVWKISILGSSGATKLTVFAHYCAMKKQYVAVIFYSSLILIDTDKHTYNPQKENWKKIILIITTYESSLP